MQIIWTNALIVDRPTLFVVVPEAKAPEVSSAEYPGICFILKRRSTMMVVLMEEQGAWVARNIAIFMQALVDGSPKMRHNPS